MKWGDLLYMYIYIWQWSMHSWTNWTWTWNWRVHVVHIQFGLVCIYIDKPLRNISILISSPMIEIQFCLNILSHLHRMCTFVCTSRQSPDLTFFGTVDTDVACRQETLTLLGHLVSSKNVCLFRVRNSSNKTFHDWVPVNWETEKNEKKRKEKERKKKRKENKEKSNGKKRKKKTKRKTRKQNSEKRNETKEKEKKRKNVKKRKEMKSTEAHR